MIAINLFLHDILMQLGKDLRGKDILTKDAIILLLTILVAHTQKLLGITGLGFLQHRRDIEKGAGLVLPDTVKNTIAAHFSKRDGVNADHQRVATLIFLDHLERTGLVGVAAIKGITQEQHHRFVTRKLRRLIDGMTETALFSLIDIMQTLTYVEDMIFVLLGLSIQLAQMFLGQRTLEIVGVLLTLLLGSQDKTDLLDATLDEFVEQDEDDRAHHAVRTGYVAG